MPAGNLFERIEKRDELCFGHGAHIGNAKNFVLEVALARVNDIAHGPEPIVQCGICHPFGQIIGGDAVRLPVGLQHRFDADLRHPFPDQLGHLLVALDALRDAFFQKFAERLVESVIELDSRREWHGRAALVIDIVREMLIQRPFRIRSHPLQKTFAHKDK